MLALPCRRYSSTILFLCPACTSNRPVVLIGSPDVAPPILSRYLYLNREDYEDMKGRGAVVCEEIVDEDSGEVRFKILVSVECRRKIVTTHTANKQKNGLGKTDPLDRYLVKWIIQVSEARGSRRHNDTVCCRCTPIVHKQSSCRIGRI